MSIAPLALLGHHYSGYSKMNRKTVFLRSQGFSVALEVGTFVVLLSDDEQKFFIPGNNNLKKIHLNTIEKESLKLYTQMCFTRCALGEQKLKQAFQAGLLGIWMWKWTSPLTDR